MKMFRVFLLLFLSMAFMLLTGCRDKSAPTKPPEALAPDTSSHEFEWQMEVLGDGEASNLQDVFIINENDIWTVGRIHVKDSTGQFIYPAFGAAHWNGKTWELKRLPAQAPGYITYLTPNGIFAFDSDNIWFAHGGVHHFDGRQIRSFWVNSFPGNTNAILDSGQFINKLWGTSDSNLWAVGERGGIIHYDGTTWHKLESGTTLDIQDIWGARGSFTGEDIILAVAANIFTSYEKEILQIKGTHVEKISTLGIAWPVDAIWFDPGWVYYTAGAGIYSRKTLAAGESWGGPGLSVTTFVSRALRGNHVNDVFVVGAFGDVLHYNGKSWRSYRETTALAQGSYLSVAVKENLVFAVGENLTRAVVVRGKRMAKRN